MNEDMYGDLNAISSWCFKTISISYGTIAPSLQEPCRTGTSLIGPPQVVKPPKLPYSMLAPDARTVGWT